MIYGKVGNLGHGKTLRMTVDGLAMVQSRNRPDSPCWLAANYTVRPPSSVRFDLLPMDGFGDRLRVLMREARDQHAGLVVLVDEIDTVWDAHAWQDMKRSHRYLLKQGRKYRTDLIWAAQFVDQVEKSLRNVTEEVELVRAFPRPTQARRDSGRRPWFIRGHRFRPGAVRELIVGEPEKDKRLGSAWHRYRREHEGLYDTDEIIEPQDEEALCARHRREESEDRCPRCHPRTGSPGAAGAEGSALAELAVEAISEPERTTRFLDMIRATNGNRY